MAYTVPSPGNYVVEVVETGKYFIDNKKHLCKKVLHKLTCATTYVEQNVFKRIDHDGIDIEIMDRYEEDMTIIPQNIVDGMFISLA